MSDVRLPKGARARLGAVDGDLVVESGVTIESETPSGVTVRGDAHFTGDATVQGPFTCRRLQSRKSRLRFESSLTVHDAIDADHSTLEVLGPLGCLRVDVDKELHLHADSTVGRLDVGGRFVADGAVRGESIRVGGSAEVRGRTEADEVSVGGQAVLGEVDLARFEVGGLGTVGGGTIRERVAVGGKFSSTGRLVFGDLEVGGTATLEGGGAGRKVDVGGVLRVGGPFQFDRLSVGGILEIEGNGAGARLDVGGRFWGGGDLTLSDRLEVGGQANVVGVVAAGSLEIGGEFVARRATITTDVEVGGRIRTEQGLHAAKIVVGRKCSVQGALIGERIRIGRSATTESVFGGSVDVGPDAHVEYIGADEVQVAGGARVGRIEYVRDVRVDAGATIDRPPQRVTTRPAPPV
jgi:cytoskeletal protein CcmA (bactofilin family)